MKRILARIPPKLLLVMGGITLLGGGSGTAAIYLGTDTLLGPSFSGTNGLACTTLETVRIRKNDRYWIRKYVVTDRRGDGMERLKTALRVAKAVQRAEKPDLVQVSVLDVAGPTGRAAMRGRAIGAQAIYISDPATAPEGVAVWPIGAFYLDGTADAEGRFWGMRIEFTHEEAELISAALPDDAGCIEPAAEGVAAHGVAGHEIASAHGALTAGMSDDHGDEPSETLGQEAFNRIRDAITAVFGKGGEDAPVTPALSEDGPPSPQPVDAAVKTAS